MPPAVRPNGVSKKEKTEKRKELFHSFGRELQASGQHAQFVIETWEESDERDCQLNGCYKVDLPSFTHVI